MATQDDEPDDIINPTLTVSLYGSAISSTKVLLHPTLTPSELSACISQLFPSQSPIAGLYDTTGVFVPLSHVISSPPSSILAILPPSSAPKEKKGKSPLRFLSDPYVATGAALTSVLAYASGLIDSLLSWLLTVPIHLLDVVVEAPLKQAYRYGPAAIGWEGLSYPAICSRITYGHGDEAFWAKNLKECKNIFYAKEAAAMAVVKPSVYAGIFAVMVYLALAFVKASAKSKPDPDMVATFRAVKTLGKQMGK